MNAPIGLSQNGYSSNKVLPCPLQILVEWASIRVGVRGRCRCLLAASTQPFATSMQSSRRYLAGFSLPTASSLPLHRPSLPSRSFLTASPLCPRSFLTASYRFHAPSSQLPLFTRLLAALSQLLRSVLAASASCPQLSSANRELECIERAICYRCVPSTASCSDLRPAVAAICDQLLQPTSVQTAGSAGH